MAATKTKARKPAAAEPAPKPKRADVMAMADRIFRDRCAAAVKDHESEVAKFTDEASKDPLYAVRWHAQKVAEAHGERRVWGAALNVYEQTQGDNAAKLAAVLDYVTAAILDAARYPSTVRSTCPFTTAIASYEGDAKSRARCMIRDMAEVYGRSIDEAEDDRPRG